MKRTETGTPPLAQTARDRIRAQARREQELAARVIAAESRLDAERAKRACVLAARDRAVASRQDAVADALIAYVDEAGVRIERAAVIVGQKPADVARLVNARRAALRRDPNRDSA
jgi:hypothetical protein